MKIRDDAFEGVEVRRTARFTAETRTAGGCGSDTLIVNTERSPSTQVSMSSEDIFMSESEPKCFRTKKYQIIHVQQTLVRGKLQDGYI